MIKKSLLAALSIASRIGSALLLMVVCGRVLGVSDFGSMMYWLTVGGILAQFVDFGMPQRVSVLIARGEHGGASQTAGVLQAAFATKLVLSALVVLIAAAFIGLNEQGRSEAMFALPLLLSQLLLPWTDLGSAVLRLEDQYKRETHWQLLGSMAVLAIVAATALISKSIVAVAYAFLLARIIVAYGWIRMLHGAAGLRRGTSFDWPTVRGFVAGSFTSALDVMATNVFSSLDTLLGRYYLGTVALGNYQAGLRLVQGSAQLSGVLQSVLLPTVARKFAASEGRGNTTDPTIVAYALFGLVLGLGTALLGKPVILLLFGSGFQAAADLAGPFGALIAVRFLAGGFGLLLMAQGRPGLRLWSYALAALGLAASVWLTLPQAGLPGLVRAMVLAYGLLTALYALKLAFTSKWYRAGKWVWLTIFLNMAFIWSVIR
ncbi:oligosaccharide flippase family protein [Chitinimonas arctica]|uniref:Oligosaccharide flippase family protein n=1 Tax=Chitinimonas arctica TaxID=2594795 RepID=A0A516SEU8_9NEIS|nr:oligosaccharide flippase family protein [Chitinimonas arctica]QDQ26671.1 oligosaccharide flippase family protein [Chitinimonas arctica]